MSDVRHITVGPEDDGQRLDRWLKKCVPELPYGLAQKLIRKGAIRVDEIKSKMDTRLIAGQKVRIPPIEDKPERVKKERVFTENDQAYIRSLVIYDDGDIIAFNKPAGLASQGGGGVEHHIDAYFPLLMKNDMIPRLIHRLDRDTSGILLAARSAEAVRRLGKSFKNREVRKIYWAVTVGVPERNAGTIKAPLIKAGGPIKDKMVIDDDEGKYAETDFVLLDKLGTAAAFIAFWPRTGRTHQIRVHASDVLGCPVLGDGKYGGFICEELEDVAIAKRLHLHARRLILQHPLEDKMLDFSAPLPEELKKSWRELGFDPGFKDDPFADPQ
ncbi:MAG: RluA family pseudouridine synthase [Alphaproteobacteria bacterium CG_4_9_14_3_um_filter_47_13]|nr:MAG: RluA family pseudouridine synthase [Alphaproteobacteria bacterium CG_4_9_14_3_um_filter_47_13]